MENDFAGEHVFFIDGFPDYTRQHLAILEHLIQNSPMVTVGINCDVLDSNALAFEKAADTASQLIRCAKNAGIAVNSNELEIEFNDLYEGKVEFNLKTDFYKLEKLYEACNVDIIDDYIEKVKR